MRDFSSNLCFFQSPETRFHRNVHPWRPFRKNGKNHNVHYAKDASSSKQQWNSKLCVHFTLRANVDLNAKKQSKAAQNFHSKGLKEKTENFVWLDVLNNSFYGHQGEKKRPLAVYLINVLINLPQKLSALVYFQRNRTLYMFDSLQKLGISNLIQVFSIVKDLIPLESRTVLIFWTILRHYAWALRMNWRTLNLSCENNVIVTAKLPPKTDRNSLVGLPETFKRK